MVLKMVSDLRSIFFFGPGKYPKTDVETDWGHLFVTFFWSSWSLLWDLWPPLLTDGKKKTLNSTLSLGAAILIILMFVILYASIHIVYIYMYIFTCIPIYFLPVTLPLVCILFIIANSDSVQEEKPSFGMAPPKARLLCPWHWCHSFSWNYNSFHQFQDSQFAHMIVWLSFSCRDSPSNYLLSPCMRDRTHYLHVLCF